MIRSAIAMAFAMADSNAGEGRPSQPVLFILFHFRFGLLDSFLQIESPCMGTVQYQIV
jgi:hypothetical protein